MESGMLQFDILVEACTESILMRLVRKLVDLLDSAEESVKDATTQALWAGCSFNQLNKMSCLRCLVHDLLSGQTDRLEHINAFLPDMDVSLANSKDNSHRGYVLF